VEFGFLEAFDGHKFWPEESLRRSWPEAVMTRAAEPLTGDFPLADQTMVLGIVETLPNTRAYFQTSLLNT
jgi:hypothetical protein